MSVKPVLNPPYVSPKQKQVNAFRDALTVETPAGVQVPIRYKEIDAWGDVMLAVKADVPLRPDPQIASVSFWTGADPFGEFARTYVSFSSTGANRAGVDLNDVKVKIASATQAAGLPAPEFGFED